MPLSIQVVIIALLGVPYNTQLSRLYLQKELQFSTNSSYIKIKFEMENLVSYFDPKTNSKSNQSNDLKENVTKINSAELSLTLENINKSAKILQKFILLNADYSILSRGLKLYSELKNIFEWAEIISSENKDYSKDELTLKIHFKDLTKTLGPSLLQNFRQVELRIAAQQTKCFEGTFYNLSIQKIDKLFMFPKNFEDLEKIQIKLNSQTELAKSLKIRETQIKIAQVASLIPTILMVSASPLTSEQEISTQPDLIFWILKEQIDLEIAKQLIPVLEIYNNILTQKFSFFNNYDHTPYLERLSLQQNLDPTFQNYMTQLQDILDQIKPLAGQIKERMKIFPWVNPLEELSFLEQLIEQVENQTSLATKILLQALKDLNIKLELRGIQIKANYQNFTNFIESKRNSGKMADVPGCLFYEYSRAWKSDTNTFNPIFVEAVKSILGMYPIEKYQTRDRRFFQIKVK